MFGGDASSSATPNACPISEAGTVNGFGAPTSCAAAGPPMWRRSTILKEGPLASMKVSAAGSSPGAICGGGGAPAKPVTAASPGAMTVIGDCCASAWAAGKARNARARARGGERSPRTPALPSPIQILSVRPPLHLRLLRRLHGVACPIGQIRLRSWRTAGSAGGDLGGTAAGAVRRPHFVVGAWCHAFAADVDLTVGAGDSRQRNRADGAGRIDGRLDRRHRGQPGVLAEANLRKRPGLRGGMRAVRALAGIGPRAIV